MAQVFDYEIGKKVPLSLRYLENGVGVSGLTVKVKLRDTSNGKYLDFSGQQWKSSGWVQQEQSLTDIGYGQYQYIWDTATAVVNSMIVAAEYEVTDIGYEAVSTDFLLFGVTDLNPSVVAAAVWDKQTVAHQQAGSFGLLLQQMSDSISTIRSIEEGRWKIENNQLIFYKEDNTTEIARFNLFDKSGQPTEDQVFDRVRV